MFVKGEPSQDDGVDDGEDGGAGADAERQDDEGDDRKGAGFSERADCRFQVFGMSR